MYSRIMRDFKWLALLLVPILVGVGCTGSATETIQTSVPPASPESAVTPTAIPPSASDPAVTPSAVPSPVEYSKAQGEVFYEDEFTDSASGWPNAVVFDNYYIGYHEPDWYHVEVQAQNDNALTVLPNQSFNDFTVETAVFVEEPLSAPEGDFRYGLATHRAGKRFYAFTISPRTQTWYVLKSSPSGLEVLDDGTDDSIQGGSAADALRVDAIGPVLTFHINGQPVSQINDPDYDSGELGFYVETFDAPRVHIHYDSLTIRKPEAPPPLQNVFFADEFTDTASGWPNAVVFDNYYIGYHEPDWYHVEVQAQNDNALTVLPDQSFDDFTVETAVFVEEPLSAPEGDFRYGLATHRSGNRFYAFTVSPRTQSWYVLKSSPSGLEVLHQGSDDLIGEVGTDTLRVDSSGSTLTFHINGRPVSQINDPDYASGELGFYVETFDAPRAHIHYDSLTIRQAEATEVAQDIRPTQNEPTPTATTPAPATPDPLCTVVAGNLNLRSGPGTAYRPPITALPNGTRLEPLARSPDSLWIQVRVPESDQVGWVAAAFAYVSCEVSVPDLPVGDIQATPTGSAP